jgi:nucleotidyltransferase substrate binding protein (TIGR01987 family)
MTLDFTPLRNAIDRLDEGLRRHLSEPDDVQIRDGLIKRFEFTYDMSHKSLRRAIEAASANPEEVDQMTFPTLIRTAFEQGLVAGDWNDWQEYRKMRNITSHTYDEAKAREVSAAIPGFLAEAIGLLANLEKRSQR